MQIDVMDKILIDIYNIRHIEYINFWDLHGTKDSKILVIPAIMITYDGGKTLNLCSKDKYFDIYVKKIVQVYNDEKNNILEDSLTDPFKLRQKIRIDERTRKILDSGILENINEVYKFYEGKEKYQNSLLFQIDEVKSLIPIIKYHIKKVFDFTDIVINLDGDITGYREVYSLNGKINGIDKFFILSFKKIDNNSYDISIQGLLSKNIPFNMKIDFNNDSLSVNSYMGDRLLECNSTYLVTNGVVKEIHSIKKLGIPIMYENNDLEEVENTLSNITDIDNDTNLRWFRLPFGALYGIDNRINEVSENEKVIERHNMIVSTNNDSFMLKEYYSKSYCRNRTVSVDALDITLDEVRKNISCVCIDSIKGIYAIESSFLDENGKNGYYDQMLAGNYFYHIVSSNEGIKGISRDSLIPISKEDNVLSGIDLLNKANVYKLVKGE